MSTKIENINIFIQKKMAELKTENISAVEMAEYLDEAQILKDNKSRPGLPLRNYLRSNSILGGYQNQSRRWFIQRLEDDKDFISVAKAARILKVSEHAIYKKIERNEIEPKIIGKNRFLIPKDAVTGIVNDKKRIHQIKERETLFSLTLNIKQQVSKIKEDLMLIINKLHSLESKIEALEENEDQSNNHKTEIEIGNEQVTTLDDILPVKPGLKMLIIAKTPAPISVRAGHYFQGKHGKMLWNKLQEYNIFTPSENKFEDECLLDYDFGITDIVKVPHDFGNEPSSFDYQSGADRIMNLIELHKPKVIFFVYKKVLDNILRIMFNITTKSKYGFNPEIEEYFKCKVFVFPMPGTPCKADDAHQAMLELHIYLSNLT